MSTNVGDLVLDPFGGSGTAFVVCEEKQRRWIGIELASADIIVERLETKTLRSSKNEDFVDR
jgi:site-specific DNA-methyltransferase (adenine-specific)